VRTLLQLHGLADKGRGRGKYLRKRQRRPLVGMLLHLDASTHQWLEGIPARDLVLMTRSRLSASDSRTSRDAHSARRRARRCIGSSKCNDADSDSASQGASKNRYPRRSLYQPSAVGTEPACVAVAPSASRIRTAKTYSCPVTRSGRDIWMQAWNAS